MGSNELMDRDGWDSLELDSEPVDEAQKALALEFASRYRRVFDSPDGKALLDHWIKQTVMQPIVHARATQFEAGIREGRADFVRGILAQIELAKTGGQS